ncbi:MAG: hypothetical protein Q9219_000449 [cf. Caloplaca sp. 3 TL-2023]
MEGPLPHHFATAHALDPSLFNPQLHPGHPSLGSHLDLDTDPFQFTSHFDHQPQIQTQPRITFEQRPPIPARFQELSPNARGSDQLSNDFTRSGQAGQFGILTPHPPLPNQPQIHHAGLGRFQNEIDLRPVAVQDGGTTEGHFSNMKTVPNPPDLENWRKKLFEVEDTVTMTEEEFQTYFPHIDNVYSHRSTQKYKRKPFVSHYWDCRMKGRPPGTAKSDDPSKKKRKRQARERDLCDVKIKITEYFPGARRILGQDAPLAPSSESTSNQNNGNMDFFSSTQSSNPPQSQKQQRQFPFISPNDGTMTIDGTLRFNNTAGDSARFYTIQRVNGNGANGKGDGTAGPHKHSLEDSDKIKKNSVLRHMLKEEKERKKSELKGFNYQYIEVDPYKKPESLTAINPRGLVPALRHGDWGCYESTVLMEYLEDLSAGRPLFPQGDAKLRAHCRLWTDHINRNIIPAFYSYLQAQEVPKQIENAGKLQSEISKLIDVAHPSGPYFLGTEMSFVDVQFAPWVIRMRRVLTPYRGWPLPETGSRWASWVDAIENDPHVKATTSTDDLYLDSYERYAGELVPSKKEAWEHY